MLVGCIYHLLDSLLPPLPVICNIKILEEKKNEAQFKGCYNEDFLRLEYLSACQVMQDVSTADKLLPHVPSRLYPALFQAIAQKQFHTWRKTSGRPHSAATLSLVSLMNKWPYQTMTVRNLMLPLSVARRNIKWSTLKNLCEDLDKFCYSFLSLLPFTFLSRYSKDDQLPKQCNISKLDMSGYYSFYEDIPNLKNLQDTVKKAYNPNSPSNYDKCELVIDTRILCEKPGMLGVLGVICTISQHHGAGLVVKFRRVNIVSAVADMVILFIEHLSKNNATEYLELYMCDLRDDVTNKLLLLSETLSGLSLAYNSGFTSIQFLSHLPHLCQLDLSGIRLNGKLTPLNHLSQGLKYLKLVGCLLKHTDLEILATSHHTRSLYQLDLSSNSFSLPVNLSSLCNLCQQLTQVVILELQNCSLNKITGESFINFTDILRASPKLRILKLSENDFSSRIITNHLPNLAYSRTLQYLCLTIPSDTYLSDDYNVVEYQIKKIQSDFTKNVQTLSASQLYVEWNEDISYSHWYYTL